MRQLTKLFPVTILLISALTLRTWNLTLHDLSGDEAFTIVTWTPAPIDQLISTIGTIDPQPPLALLSTVTWLRLAGITEFAARLYSVLASSILISAIYALAHRLFNQRIALLAMLIITVNPYQLWIAQDVRPYAPWMATAALATLTLIALISKHSPSHKTYLLHSAASLLALGMFYFQVFNILASNILALLFLRKTRPNVIRWIASQIFLLIALFLYLSATDLLTGVYKPTASSVDLLDLFAPLLLGHTWPYPSVIFSFALALIPFISFFIASPRHFATLKLFLLITIPPLSLAAITIITTQPYFRARYVTSIIGPLTILVAAATASTARQSRSTATTLLGILLTGSLISINTYHFNPAFAKAPQWRQIMALLTANLDTDDLVLQNYPDPSFTYYYHGKARTFVLPVEANPPTPATTATITTLTKTHRYVWFFPTPNPAWDRDQVVATWLTSNLPLINQYWIRNTHILEFAPSEPLITDLTTQTTVEYANILRTDGWRISPLSTTSPNTTITFELFYHPIATTSQTLTFFVHLIPSTANSPIAQSDHPPQNQLSLPTTWHPSMLLRDIFTLTVPPNTSPGTYQLFFGLYDSTTNIRLIPTNYPNSPSRDSILITTITVIDQTKKDAP